MTHIQCDQCQADLTGPVGYPTWRLTLKCEKVPEAEIMLTVAVLPIINRDRHFCSMRCLDVWAAGRGEYDRDIR